MKASLKLFMVRPRFPSSEEFPDPGHVLGKVVAFLLPLWVVVKI